MNESNLNPLTSFNINIMLIPTWLPFVICASLAIILLNILYRRPYNNTNKLWSWVNHHIIGTFGTIVMAAIFIPVVISWTAPRIWIVKEDENINERIIVFYYKNLSVGFCNKYVENATHQALVAEKVFYGNPKPNTNPQGEICSIQPHSSLKISSTPYFRLPSKRIIDRHYGVSHKYGRYQWFIYKL